MSIDFRKINLCVQIISTLTMKTKDRYRHQAVSRNVNNKRFNLQKISNNMIENQCHQAGHVKHYRGP